MHAHARALIVVHVSVKTHHENDMAPCVCSTTTIVMEFGSGVLGPEWGGGGGGAG